MGPIARQWIKEQTKLEILAVIETSQQQGVSVRRSCVILVIDHRRIVRWQERARQGRGLANLTPGPKEPLPRVLPEEIDQIVAMAKSQEYVDLSHRILAVTAWDKGLFQASFSTVYRVLKEQNLMSARGPGGAQRLPSTPAEPELTSRFMGPDALEGFFPEKLEGTDGLGAGLAGDLRRRSAPAIWCRTH